MHRDTSGKILLHRAWMGLRSLLSLLVATATLVGLTWASGEAGDHLGLAGSGQTRLAWDLAGLVLAGAAGFWMLARLAPVAPGKHVAAGLVLLAGLAVWAVWQLGESFPAWFSAVLLLSLPLQAWAGWRLGGRAR